MYRRNSLRYPGYDYSQPGTVFVTFNTHQNQRLFGGVQDGRLLPSPAGLFVQDAWLRLPERFPDIAIDEFIVMPDHVHGIVFTGTDPEREDRANTVGFVIRSFKNIVMSEWRRGVLERGWPRYDMKLWHRDYFDRIIRNDEELEAIREYIRGNPARWSEKRDR